MALFSIMISRSLDKKPLNQLKRNVKILIHNTLSLNAFVDDY